jgi:hypothetical protein
MITENYDTEDLELAKKNFSDVKNGWESSKSCEILKLLYFILKNNNFFISGLGTICQCINFVHKSVMVERSYRILRRIF